MSVQAPMRNKIIYEPGQAPVLAKLLAEYTEKLRADCDKLEVAYQRKNVSTATLIIGVIFGLVAGYYLGEAIKAPYLSSSANIILAARIITIAVIGIGVGWFAKEIIKLRGLVQMYLRHNHSQVTASIAQLERLIRRTSPIAEHSNLSLSEKLELDLRLADADAVLEYATQHIGKSSQHQNTITHAEVLETNIR